MSQQQNIYHLLDLTCLKEQVTAKDIEKLAELGQTWHVAALCVWPQHLKDIPQNCHLQKATVVNFPNGTAPKQQVLEEIQLILKDFPGTEIDYVFNYQAFLHEKRQQAVEDCASIVEYCHQHQAICKVIIETGAFPDSQSIEDAARAVIQNGADMLKTSTGKIAVGATYDAVRAFCHAIQKEQRPCGIKISGGIRTLSQARKYLALIHQYLPDLKNIRFGCSQLVDDKC